MAAPRSRTRGTITVRRARLPLALGIAAVATLVGCSPDSRSRLLVLLFEDAPQHESGPEAVVRRPRHPAPPTPTPTAGPHTGASTVATFRTWDDVVRLLPKDPVGKPDWVAALEEKVIAPRPGIAPGAPETEILALDVELVPPSDPAFKVVFSHQKHGEWLACESCHPARFESKAGTTPMAGAAAHGERYCGACHGTVAFAVAGGCPLCHLRGFPKDAQGRVDWIRALAAGLIAPGPGRVPDQPSADLDVELTSKTQPTVKSVFSHATHTRILACANCHPGLFPMAAGGAEMESADLHSRRYCGACHGTVAFGITTACERCHPKLEKSRQHQVVLDLDVAVPSKGQPSGQTTFSHKVHRWVECSVCHANLYGGTAGATRMAVDDVLAGKYCGACHGRVTADLMSNCQRCHAVGEAR